MLGRASSVLLVLALTACATGSRDPFGDGFTPEGDDGGTEPGTVTTLSGGTLDPSAGPGATSGDDTPATGSSPDDTGCAATDDLCNGEDDDCDGEIDEDDPDVDMPCDTGEPGACAAGVYVCSGALGPTCEPSAVAAAETCNGIDDDCNGMVDDGNPEGGAACSTGQPGVCDAGTMTCTAGALECAPDTPAAAMDACGNGIDDDCNGMVDDGCSLTCQDTDLGNAVPQSVSGNNGASADTFVSSCGGGPDYLFLYTAAVAGTYTFDTIGSSFDTVLTAYSDCMGTEITCNDDFAGNPTTCGTYACSEVSVTLGAGEQVIIAVEGFQGATGAFTVNVGQ